MSTKTKDELLLDYRKSNKTRRAKIVSKAGFASEAEYLAFLMDPEEATGSSAAAALFAHNKKEETDMLDQVIAFDTTGSMNGYIAAVKKHVKDLIPKLFADNKNLRLKVIAFGDYCDMIGPNNFGKAYQESPLTDNQDTLINFVTNAQSTSGGDGDEFYELVIKKVVEETPWRTGSKRAMLLIADADPHPIGYTFGGYGSRGKIITNNQIDWRQEAKKAAAIGLQIDTLNCGPTYQNTFYRPLSDITNGVNIPFTSQDKTQHAVYAATSVRGSKLSKRSFEASYMAALEEGDDELIGTYKSLSSKL